MFRTPATKIIAWVAGLVALAIVGVLVFVSLHDLNFLRPTINQRVADALGRAFEIRGDLGLDWTRDHTASGWRAWVPQPQIHAADIRLGNPDYIDKPVMAHIARFEATLAPLGLLSQRIAIPRVAVVQPRASLIKRADGRNNWSFDLASQNDADEKDTSWSVALDKLVFDDAKVAYRDATLDADFVIHINTLGEPVAFSQVTGAANASGKKPAAIDDYIFGLSIDGRYQGAPLSGNGKIGGVLALKTTNRPFPVQVALQSGPTRVEIAGTVTQPLALGGADLDLSLSGASLSNLYALTGVALPATPAYSTNGHLDVRFDADRGSRFAYKKFSGTIGASDIQGSLVYDTAGARPKLTGRVVSKQLRFADLAPLVGADSKKHKQKRGVETSAPKDKVLSPEPFRFERLNAMDADVRFQAERIQHGDTLPLSGLHTHVTLEEGSLLLDPLSFGMAGGHLNTTLRLVANAKPLHGRIDMHLRHVQIDRVAPKVEALQGSLGEINADATLRGQGNSLAALLGTSNGRLTVLVDNGTISRNLMELAGLNIGNYLVGKIFGDEQVRINCAAADIPVEDGLAEPNVFVFDTKNTVVYITGQADFDTEKLDLTITPKSKGARVLTLRTPLYVQGSFADPSPGVKPGPLIARGAAAVALGVFGTPAASLLALVSVPAGDENRCGPVLERIQSADKQAS